MNMKIFVGSLILVAAGISAHAQEPKVLTPTAPLPAAKVLAEIAAGSGRAVKNAPFSAEAVSESVQTLADGNRIVHNSTTKLYRNSEGRTRRQMVNGDGSLGTGFSFSYSPGVTILDSVGGNRYLLDDKLKTAEQMVLKATTVLPTIRTEALTDEQKAAIEKATSEARLAAPAIAATLGAQTITGVGGGVNVYTPTPDTPAARPRYETKTEQLGVQNIEGIEAEGTRTTTIIPAGAIGNERPIETVYEKWYSKELQLVVMSKHTDPRFGEQTYRLTNIVRAEPDPSLFALPAGYRVRADPSSTYRVSPARADSERVLTVKAAQAPAAVKNKP
jgi:hypothetical protein